MQNPAVISDQALDRDQVGVVAGQAVRILEYQVFDVVLDRGVQELTEDLPALCIVGGFRDREKMDDMKPLPVRVLFSVFFLELEAPVFALLL